MFNSLNVSTLISGNVYFKRVVQSGATYLPFFTRSITQGTNQKICIYIVLSRYVLKSLFALLSFENQIRQVTLLDRFLVFVIDILLGAKFEMSSMLLAFNALRTRVVYINERFKKNHKNHKGFNWGVKT